MKGGWLYIVTNRLNGTLYTGVTSSMTHRAHQHREGLIPGFTKQHDLKLLVYVEHHDTIEAAIQRERTIKTWPRAWKVRLIMSVNPDWKDLYETIV